MTRPRYSFNNLFFEATRRCNLACPMCMAGSNDGQLVGAKASRELTTDEIERHVLATVRDIGVDTITWSGGEFVVRDDAVELVGRAAEYGYASIVATNGVLMTRSLLAELDAASGRTLVVAVGINSIDEDNAATRDTDCDLAMGVLDLCEEKGIRRNVVVTVGKPAGADLAGTSGGYLRVYAPSPWKVWKPVGLMTHAGTHYTV